MFAAILDTCVLWPSLQRDFVLSMAVEGLYRRLWSEAILEELHRHEQRKWLGRGDVVAAAVVGGAGAIVTEDVKDIRQDLIPAHIQVLCVREFAANTADVDPARAARALQVLASRHRNPARTPEELLALLVERYSMIAVGDILAPMLSDLQ